MYRLTMGPEMNGTVVVTVRVGSLDVESVLALGGDEYDVVLHTPLPNSPIESGAGVSFIKLFGADPLPEALIDSEHATVRALCADAGITLLSSTAGRGAGTPVDSIFDGVSRDTKMTIRLSGYDLAEIERKWSPIMPEPFSAFEWTVVFSPRFDD